MVKLRFIYLGADDSTLILNPVESVLAALGLIDAQLCSLCGSHASLGDDPSFDGNLVTATSTGIRCSRTRTSN